MALAGSFDEEFLRVPSEALVSSMQVHQKYFPLVDASGSLLPRFITVSNIESRDPAVIRAGNERVIRPRLADAMFFWEKDGRKRLADHVVDLAQVVFQKDLGSMADKSQRVAALAVEIAEQIGGDPALARRVEGVIAKIAAAHAEQVVAVESDPAVVDHLYRRLRADGQRRILSISAQHIRRDPWLAVMETLRHEMLSQYDPDTSFANVENRLQMLIITAKERALRELRAG